MSAPVRPETRRQRALRRLQALQTLRRNQEARTTRVARFGELLQSPLDAELRRQAVSPPQGGIRADTQPFVTVPQQEDVPIGPEGDLTRRRFALEGPIGGITRGLRTGLDVAANLPGGESIQEAINVQRRQEEILREQGQVSLLGQISSDLAKFLTEFQIARALPGARGLLAPARGQGVARRAATEAFQLGAFDQALAAAEGATPEEAAARGRRGVLIGGAAGGVVGAAGAAIGRIGSRALARQDALRRIQALRGSEGTAPARRQAALQRLDLIQRRAETPQPAGFRQFDRRAQQVQRVAAERGRETGFGQIERTAQAFGPPSPTSRALERADRALAAPGVARAGTAAREAALGRMTPQQRGALEMLLRRERASLGEAGAITPELQSSLSGAGVGALSGAAVDQENPLRGAVLGAAAGAGLGLTVGRTLRTKAVDPSTLKPHERRVQQQLSIGEREIVFPSVRDLYQTLFKRDAGLVRAGRQLQGGQRVAVMKDVEVAAELASGSARRTEGFLEVGPARWTEAGELVATGTPAYKATLAMVRKDLNSIRRYEVSARTLEVAEREIQTGITPVDARQIVAEASPTLREAGRHSVQFRRDMLRYYADAGGASPEAVQAMEEMGQAYVSLRRAFGKQPSAPGTGGLGRPGALLRRLTGSERPIIDPIESTVDMTQRMVRAADLNRISRSLIDLAEEFPERAAGLIERVGAGAAKPSVAAKQLQANAAKHGVTLSDDVAAELTSQLSDKALTVADDIVHVYRNGVREQWRVAPEIAKSFRAMAPQDMPWWVRLMGLPAQGLRSGVTLNPAFQLTNAFRDTLDASVQSQYGFRPGVDSFKGFFESAKAVWLGMPSARYANFVRAGGGFSNLRGSDRRSIQRQVERLVRGGSTRPERILSATTLPIRHPIEVLKQLAQPFEEAARVGEFLLARKAGESTARSVIASKKVTVDFQQIGAGMQGLAYMTSFLNAAAQSLDIFFRTLVRPGTKAAAAVSAGKSGREAAGVFANDAARVYGAAVGAISMPSVLLWAASIDDEEIRDLRKSRAGLIYWFVRTPGGEVIRLPKPFLWGQVFGTGVESVLDQMFDQDPNAMTRWAVGVKEQATANVVPNLGQIVLEQKLNEDQFFGTPVVPRELLDVEPRFQSTERTGTIARAIGDRLNISPARIESVVRDVTGTLGSKILETADRVVNQATTGDVAPLEPVSADLPLIGRFFARLPSTSVESVQEFWKQANAAREAQSTFNLLEREGNVERLRDLVQRRELDLIRAPLFDAARRQMRSAREAIDIVREAPGLTPRQKREQTDKLLQQIVDTARLVIKAGT